MMPKGHHHYNLMKCPSDCSQSVPLGRVTFSQVPFLRCSQSLLSHHCTTSRAHGCCCQVAYFDPICFVLPSVDTLFLKLQAFFLLCEGFSIQWIFLKKFLNFLANLGHPSHLKINPLISFYLHFVYLLINLAVSDI